MTHPRIAFAGDRDIAVWVLQFLLEQDVVPLALLLPDTSRASHDTDLAALCPMLSQKEILRGTAFREPRGVELLRSLEIDYIIGIHFPYIIPGEVLEIPQQGVLNLHPAYLPYNRGWHTPSWAILEGTPIGATLHFMDEDVDTGEIVHQKQLEVSPADTAHTLYYRLRTLELETFKEAWSLVASGQVHPQPQDPTVGTAHRRRDLFQPSVQRIDLHEVVVAGQLLTRLRALTTNQIGEAAYFEVDGKKYRVQIAIYEDEEVSTRP